MLKESVSLYDQLGGEDWVRRFVGRFYDLMDTLPDAAPARAIHPENLYDSRQKLFEFMSGWFGGPQLFVARHGAPMLRARHLQAPIDRPEIEAWLLCFRTAWQELVADAALTDLVLPKVEALAWHMHNRPVSGTSQA